MKTTDLSKLSRLERFFYKLRTRHANRIAVRRKIKQELYKIKYGEEKKKRTPLSYGKIFTLCFSITCLILLFFIMFATIYLHDGQILIAGIGPVVAGTINLLRYNSRSKAENTAGGIVYETTMAQLNQGVDIQPVDNNAVG